MKKPSPHTHPCASRLLEDRDKTMPHLPCPDLATLGGAYDPYAHPAYEAMLTVADQIVKEYRSDWAHDLKTLARTDPSTPFVWFAYSSGTLLFTASGVREAMMGGWKATFDLIPGRRVRGVGLSGPGSSSGRLGERRQRWRCPIGSRFSLRLLRES